MEGYLVLEDGSVWEGRYLGQPKKAGGEVVFNTSMTGYQEILTDPSYRGQIVVLTYPLIGNYGINYTDSQSNSIHVRGLLIKESCPHPSNWQSAKTLAQFLDEHGIPALEQIDTRALTRHLRQSGTMKGIIVPEGTALKEALDELAKLPAISDQDLVREVTCPRPYTLAGGPETVAVLDLGVKKSILASFLSLGFTVTVLPALTPAQEILSLRPAGVLFSNGPGDPKTATYAVETGRQLIGELPLWGICLGHQILALALGADTYKLPFGHRGSNHPVKDLRTGRIYVTSQNHGYAIRAGTLPQDNVISHLNLNDGTIEGISIEELRLVSVQYHPEGSPGPTDSAYIFEQFISTSR